MRIGQLASEAGVNAQTIRFYERHGLMPRPARRANGYREYPSTTIDRIRFIRSAKQVGFTLGEIAELLSLRVRRGGTCARICDRATAKAQEIEGKIAQLRRMHRVLQRMIVACSGKRAIEDCAILGALGGGEP